MKRTIQGAALSIAVALAIALVPTSASAIAVSLELALVVDESSSVDTTEFHLQQQGYVQAFQNPTIQAAIIAAGGIAVTYVQFDDGVQQGIGWTLINSVATANNFATAINGLARFGNIGTYVENAIVFARGLFGTEVGLAGNGFESTRQIIDVSGDGRDNEPGNANSATDAATTAAIAAGIDRINGIVIDPAGEMNLLAFYQNQVQDGPGSFTVVANSFSDFGAAVKNKIFIEVTNTPEGGATLLYSFISFSALLLFAARRNPRVA